MATKKSIETTPFFEARKSSCRGQAPEESERECTDKRLGVAEVSILVTACPPTGWIIGPILVGP